MNPITTRSRRLVILAALGLAARAVTSAPADWDNPRLTGLNNEAPHATMVICPDAKTALRIGPVIE